MDYKTAWQQVLSLIKELSLDESESTDCQRLVGFIQGLNRALEVTNK